MEQQLSLFSVAIFSFPLLAITLLIFWKKIHISFPNSNPPPGPPKLPIIGNIHQLITLLPHHRLAKLSKTYGPDLMQLQLGQVQALVVSSPDAAEQVLKHFDVNFIQRGREYVSDILFYNRRDIVFAPYGEYWKQIRKICAMELLNVKRVKSFRPIREEEVSNCITSIRSKVGAPMNMSKFVYAFTNSVIAISTMGRKISKVEDFVNMIEPIIKAVGGFDLATVFPSLEFVHLINGTKSRLLKLRGQYDVLLQDIIDHHKLEMKAGGERDNLTNLLDVLLDLQKEPDSLLTDDSIKAIILDIFTGGTDTSGSTVEWAMSELSRNPKLMKKAQEEVRKVHSECGKIDETGVERLVFMKAIIKETLRLHPPAALIPRKCREKCNINGYDIQVGTEVLINTWAIGRDPKYWVEPEKFNPERFIGSHIDFRGLDYEYLPFGAGRRMCPGLYFAIANVQLVLANILCHFNWELPRGMKPEDVDMTESFGITVRRKNDLCLIPTAYGPSSQPA